MFLDHDSAREQRAEIVALSATKNALGSCPLATSSTVTPCTVTSADALRPLLRSQSAKRTLIRIALALVLFAGAPQSAIGAAPRAEDPNEPWLVLPERFRQAWKEFGTLYDDPSNPYVQKFRVFGRLHYQYGFVDGESPEGHFDYDSDELRRLRLGVGSEFLNIFALYAEAELSDDDRPSGGDFGFRFQQMWQLKLHADLKKAFGLEFVDGLQLGIGSREIHMSYEWVTSSKRIKSIERSAIANKIWAFNSDFANPTGIWFTVKLAPVTWTFGAFGTTQSQSWAPPGKDGMLYHSHLVWDAYRGPDGHAVDVRLASFYQDLSDGDETLAAGVEWAHALSLQHRLGRWELHVESVLGDNGNQSNPDREGLFWAFVGMPSYWIARDSLEAVVKFEYQGAQDTQGVRLNSRYVRRAGSRNAIPSLANGRGDEHYSVYLGLNKLFSDHQHKIMLGIEYDHLQRNDARIFDGWSFLAAYRMYF